MSSFNSDNNSNGNRIIPLTCSGHTRPVVDLQFSPIVQGKCYLISACKDSNPMLRDGVTGDWIGTFQGHKGAVWSARLSNDASKAVTGSADSSAKVWDATTGEDLYSFSHQDIVRAVDFNQDGTKIITGSKDKKLRIFSLGQDSQPVMEFSGHEGMIKAVVWDEQHNVVLSAGDDNTVRSWDLRAMRESSSFTCEAPVSTMALSIDAEYVSWAAGKTANFCKTTDFCKPDSGFKNVKTIQTKEVSSVSIHPDHKKFVAGSNTDLWVRIYDFETGNEAEVYKGHHGPIHTVSYSPDGEMYATGSEDGTIRLWQTNPTKSYGLWQKNGGNE